MADGGVSASSSSSSRPNLKRSHVEDLISDVMPDKRPKEREVRFPKKKRAREGKDGISESLLNKGEGSIGPVKATDPHLAAQARAMQRHQITAGLVKDQSEGVITDIAFAEQHYEEEDFEDDGIPIEPFNLNKEREEGYFDSDGNFVEYAREKDNIKDAWMDSIDANARHMRVNFKKSSDVVDEFDDLSAVEIWKIKRRIADSLLPDETVLQALRRFKGTSNDKRKMSEEVKTLFDQLTEDAMKLMDNGDYNVYNDRKETFEREAEGYERIASSRDSTSLTSVGVENRLAADSIFSIDQAPAATSVLNSNQALQDTTGGNDETFDMFGDDDEVAATTDGTTLASDSTAVHNSEPASETYLLPQVVDMNGNTLASNPGAEAETDYAYDESSGYYYSSTLGYYYDPSSGLYCSATTGKWYTFNELTNTYEVIEDAADAHAT